MSGSLDRVRAPGRTHWRLVVASVVIAACVATLSWIQMRSEAGRPVPAAARIAVVNTQSDVYGLLRSLGIRGAAVINLNRFHNLSYHVPDHLARSKPFPIPSLDVVPEYERGVDSHNWLFIATRTGIVRRVVTVMPEEIFRRDLALLRGDYGLRQRPWGFAGFYYDIPRRVTTLAMLPPVDEPVVLIVDAGYFGPGADPAATARLLAQSVPKALITVLVRSQDEGEVTMEMRRNLALFIRVWQVRG